MAGYASVGPAPAVIKRLIPIAGGEKRIVLELGADSPSECNPGGYIQLCSDGETVVGLPIASWSKDSRTVEVVANDKGSAAPVVSALSVGGSVQVRGPLGNPLPVKEMEGHNILMVASGYGITAVRSLIHYISAHRERYNEVALLYGAPDPTQILFQDELDRWADLPDMRVFISVERASEGWQGHLGVPTMMVSRVEFKSGDTYAFISGPYSTYKFMSLTLLSRSIPKERILMTLDKAMMAGEEAIVTANEL